MMKKYAFLISSILVLSLLFTMLCACAKDAPTVKPEQNQPTISQPAVADNVVSSENEGESAEPEEDPAEIAFWGCVVGGKAEDYSAIEAKVNEITEREINTHITMNIMSVGDYLSRGALGISSGEKADIFVRSFGPLSFSVLLVNNQIMDLTPYMDQFGAPLKEMFGDLLDAGVINGKLYAIPGYRVMNSSLYIGMRKDLLEELGMLKKAQDMTAWSEYEEIMDAVKTRYAADGIYPVAMNTSTWGALISGDSFDETKTVDYCGDALHLVGSLNDGEVKSLAWSDEQINQWSLFADWMAKGFVWPDSTYSELTSQDVVRSGAAFSELFVSEIGCEETKKGVTGFDYLCKKVRDIEMSTDNVNKFGLVVNSNCEEPEAAMKFITLLYTNPEVMNLMVYGIEGENYVVNDGIADYPVPGDSTSSGYHSDDFLYGNQFLLHPWGGMTADFREVALESFKAASPSRFLGFSMNPAEVEEIVATLSAVNDTYTKRLTGGGFTPELLTEVQKELKVAGIDEYYEEIQRQVAAWEATK